MIYFCTPLIILLFPATFYFIARALFWYHIYVGFKILITIMYKLRYQVYNNDLKLAHSSDRTIFITGATSGIGLALAKYFYGRGFKVIVGYLTTEEPGYNELRAMAPEKGQMGALFFIEINVLSKESIANAYRCVQEILDQNKLQLYAIINNAGVIDFIPAQWIPSENIENIVKTNLIGPMLVTRHFLPLLITTPDSRVINVSSGLAIWLSSCCAIYGATKSGLAYYTNCLQFDIAKYGVKAVTIYPCNLIRNTGIMRDCARYNERVVNGLTELERSIYKTDLEKHFQTVSQTQRDIRDYQKKLKSRPRKVGEEYSFLRSVYAIVTGAIGNYTELENSSLIHSFDNAVTLAQPPGEMFAGNMFFQIVVASFIEQVSQSTRLLMGLVAKKFGLDILSIQDY